MVLFRNYEPLKQYIGSRTQTKTLLFSGLLAIGSAACRSQSQDAGEQSIIGKDESAEVTRTGAQPAYVTAAIDAVGALGGECTALYRKFQSGDCWSLFQRDNGFYSEGYALSELQHQVRIPSG